MAFEPDPVNFKKLEENCRRIGQDVSIWNAATGRRRERLRLVAEGSMSSALGDGDVEVDSVALDEVLVDPPPTYIKMDIEGAEIDAPARRQPHHSRAYPGAGDLLLSPAGPSLEDSLTDSFLECGVPVFPAPA